MPNTRHGPNVFDPEIHCGAPVTGRNPEILTQRLIATERHLAKLQATRPDYDTKKLYYQRVIRVCTERLKTIEANGPDDRPCCNEKGFRTDHAGEGKCAYHCHCHGVRGWHSVTGNIYRNVHNRKLQEAMNLVEQQTIDIMDLVPEAKMLKALTIVFFEDVKTKKNVTHETLTSAAKLIDSIGKTIKTINDIQLKAGVVTYPAIIALTSEMAKEMMIVAQDMNGQPFDAQRFIESVKERWQGLEIKADAKTPMLPAHSRTVQ